MSFAVFILSTGRCGTQWLAEHLQRAYSDRFQVEHEPMHNAYHPRRMLTVHTLDDLDPEASEQIVAHTEGIETCLAQRGHMLRAERDRGTRQGHRGLDDRAVATAELGPHTVVQKPLDVGGVVEEV